MVLQIPDFSGFFLVMNKSDFFYLGKAVKINKKTAEIVISVDVDEPELYVKSKVFFIEIDGGLVPFFINELRLIGADTFRVVFEDWDDPHKAPRLVGCRVFLPSDQLAGLKDEQFHFRDIIGYTLHDLKRGLLGDVSEVFETPDQVLLQVYHQSKEILIPFADDLFVKIDNTKKQLFMNVPDGLVDLYLTM
jgi:16S rRNA processing protein RimM